MAVEKVTSQFCWRERIRSLRKPGQGPAWRTDACTSLKPEWFLDQGAREDGNTPFARWYPRRLRHLTTHLPSEGRHSRSELNYDSGPWMAEGNAIRTSRGSVRIVAAVPIIVVAIAMMPSMVTFSVSAISVVIIAVAVIAVAPSVSVSVSALGASF